MKVIIACEFSQVVTKAFRGRGHEAYSCDVLPTEGNPAWHIQDDVLRHLDDGFDALIGFPPCTRLAVSGARWFKGREAEQQSAIDFVEALWLSEVALIGLENPIGVLSTRSLLGKPSQIIQPWMFGHGETKATCLWLKGLPILRPTNIVAGRLGRVHKEPPSPERWRNRSRTYQGIAQAMAEQWG
jgi:site-specific DNA-cytosine methylase